MKKLLAIALASLMIMSMTACGNNNDSTSDTSEGTTKVAEGDETPAEDVTLRFYNYALSEQAKSDWWNTTVENFEKENKGITIDTVTVDYNSMIQTFTNDIASGQPVDLIYGETSWVPSLVDGGFIQKASDVISKDFFDGYYSNVLDQFEYKDDVYGVPHYYTNSVIFVNKKLIEAAGLSMADFPTTLDGLKEWIVTLSNFYKGDASVSSIFGLTTAEVSATGANINAIYTAFGGKLINEDGTLADLNAEPNKTAFGETLDFYKYLISNGYTQENLKLKDYRASFGAGNVCMYVDSSWGYAQIGGVDPNASDFTVTASLPTTMGTNGKGSSLVESHCFLIGSKLTDAQKVATDKFIQYCTKTSTMEEYLNNIGIAFVAHKDMEDSKVSPILEGALVQAQNVVQQTGISSIVSVQIELAKTVLDYVKNGTSIDDSISNYEKQANYYINQ